MLLDLNLTLFVWIDQKLLLSSIFYSSYNLKGSLLNYVPYVLSCLTASCPTCSCALRASCLTCPSASRASCPTCSRGFVPRALCAFVPHVSRALSTLVPHVPRAYVFLCPACICCTCSRASRASCLTCILPYVFRAKHVLGALVPHVSCALLFSDWLELYLLFCSSSLTCFRCFKCIHLMSSSFHASCLLCFC